MSLTSGRVLARNTMLNLAGQGAPMIIAIFAIPLLIKGLGTERFGVLTLVWVIIGYFSIFDFGLGRALTKLVAEKLGAGRLTDIPAIVWTTMGLILLFSLAGALILGGLADLLASHVLKVPEGLKAETRLSLYLLALSVPVVITTAGLRGILEAAQRFELVNVVRLCLGAFTYIGPLLILPFGKGLDAVVIVLLAGRIIAWIAYAVFCLRIMPSLRTGAVLDRSVIKPLLHFGTWMTVTNTLGPLMVYLDRFLIGALLSVTAVAYYTTPYEVITRLWIIPGALVGVLLPAFSSSFAMDGAVTKKLFLRAVKYIFLVMFPITLIVVMFAQEGLTLWVGPDFAEHSTRVLQWLAAGVFINSMAQVSFVLLQGVGRPDLSAKIMAVQLPFYFVAAWWAITHFGIIGAAFVWTARVGVDASLFFLAAKHSLDISDFRLHKVILPGILTLGMIFCASIDLTLLLKIVILSITLAVFAGANWHLWLKQEYYCFIKKKLIHN